MLLLGIAILAVAGLAMLFGAWRVATSFVLATGNRAFEPFTLTGGTGE